MLKIIFTLKNMRIKLVSSSANHHEIFLFQRIKLGNYHFGLLLIYLDSIFMNTE